MSSSVAGSSEINKGGGVLAQRLLSVEERGLCEFFREVLDRPCSPSPEAKEDLLCRASGVVEIDTSAEGISAVENLFHYLLGESRFPTVRKQLNDYLTTTIRRHLETANVGGLDKIAGDLQEASRIAQRELEELQRLHMGGHEDQAVLSARLDACQNRMRSLSEEMQKLKEELRRRCPQNSVAVESASSNSVGVSPIAQAGPLHLQPAPAVSGGAHSSSGNDMQAFLTECLSLWDAQGLDTIHGKVGALFEEGSWLLEQLHGGAQEVSERRELLSSLIHMFLDIAEGPAEDGSIRGLRPELVSQIQKLIGQGTAPHVSAPRSSPVELVAALAPIAVPQQRVEGAHDAYSFLQMLVGLLKDTAILDITRVKHLLPTVRQLVFSQPLGSTMRTSLESIEDFLGQLEGDLSHPSGSITVQTWEKMVSLRHQLQEQISKCSEAQPQRGLQDTSYRPIEDAPSGMVAPVINTAVSQSIAEWDKLLNAVTLCWDDYEHNRTLPDKQKLNDAAQTLLKKALSLKQQVPLAATTHPVRTMHTCILNLLGDLDCPGGPMLNPMVTWDKLNQEVSQFRSWLRGAEAEVALRHVSIQAAPAPQAEALSQSSLELRLVQDMRSLCTAFDDIYWKMCRENCIPNLAEGLVGLLTRARKVREAHQDELSSGKQLSEKSFAFLNRVDVILGQYEHLQDLDETSRLCVLGSIQEDLFPLKIEAQVLQEAYLIEKENLASRMRDTGSQRWPQEAVRRPQADKGVGLIHSHHWVSPFREGLSRSKLVMKLRELMIGAYMQSEKDRQQQLSFLEESLRDKLVPDEVGLWRDVLGEFNAIVIRELFSGDPCPTLKEIVTPKSAEDPIFGELMTSVQSALRNIGLLSHENSEIPDLESVRDRGGCWGLMEREDLKKALTSRLEDIFGKESLQTWQQQVLSWMPAKTTTAVQELRERGLDCLISLIFPLDQGVTTEVRVAVDWGALQNAAKTSPEEALKNGMDLLVQYKPDERSTEISSIYHHLLSALSRIESDCTQNQGYAYGLFQLALAHHHRLPPGTSIQESHRSRTLVVGALIRHCQVQKNPTAAFFELLQDKNPLLDGNPIGMALETFLSLGSEESEHSALFSLWRELSGSIRLTISAWSDLHFFFLKCCDTLVEMSTHIVDGPRIMCRLYHGLDPDPALSEHAQALFQCWEQHYDQKKALKQALRLPCMLFCETALEDVICVVLSQLVEQNPYAQRFLLLTGADALCREHEQGALLFAWGLLNAISARKDERGYSVPWVPGYGQNDSIQFNLDRLCAEIGQLDQFMVQHTDVWGSRHFMEAELYSEGMKIKHLTHWIIRQGLKILEVMPEDQMERSYVIWRPLLTLCREDRESQKILLKALMNSSRTLLQVWPYAKGPLAPKEDAEAAMRRFSDGVSWMPQGVLDLAVKRPYVMLNDAVSVVSHPIEPHEDTQAMETSIRAPILSIAAGEVGSEDEEEQEYEFSSSSEEGEEGNSRASGAAYA